MEEAPSLKATGTAEQMMLLIKEELIDHDEELVMVAEMGAAKGLDPLLLWEAKWRLD
jgi:hypothetical protein